MAGHGKNCNTLKTLKSTSKKRGNGMAMEIRPISLKEANIFILKYHRHHDKVQGHKFSIGCFDGEELVGIACCGRPVSRHLDNGMTLEVTRLCTLGGKNACSMLYSACARAGKAMGYKKIITYILESEHGTSLKASNWVMEESGVGGLKWGGSTKSGPRESEIVTLFGTMKKYPNEKKQRWVREL